VTPFPSVENLISHLLELLCDQTDPERAFVKFNRDDETILLINNYGGLSNLELGALTQETLDQLETKWITRPTKIYSGCFETSLNGPGFSITLFNITIAASESSTSVSELLGLLNDETRAPSWPNVLANTSTKVSRNEVAAKDIKKRVPVSAKEEIKVDPILLDAAIRLGCERALAAEPNLTKWDTEMGDGDCGEGVKGACEAIIKLLDNGVAKNGSVFETIYAIIDAVDDMGGTLGAIFAILLAAWATALKSYRTNINSDTKVIDIFAPTLATAVESLKRHTGARNGDRTVMDVLLPFVEVLDTERNLGKAARRAEEAAEGTRDLKPKFGRASYVGNVGEQSSPDPGAWALMEIIKGVQDASERGSNP